MMRPNKKSTATPFLHFLKIRAYKDIVKQQKRSTFDKDEKNLYYNIQVYNQTRA